MAASPSAPHHPPLDVYPPVGARKDSLSPEEIEQLAALAENDEMRRIRDSQDRVKETLSFSSLSLLFSLSLSLFLLSLLSPPLALFSLFFLSRSYLLSLAYLYHIRRTKHLLRQIGHENRKNRRNAKRKREKQGKNNRRRSDPFLSLCPVYLSNG